MKHLFQQGTDPNAPTLLLFHGTGGSERDFLPLAGLVSPESSLLSLKGNVLENGMPRFFKRIAEGIFDEEDLIVRSKETYDFIGQAAEQYSFDRSNTVAIGYANGANIIGGMLFHYANPFQGAVLHHPMVPLRGVTLPDLSQTSIFICAGEDDPIVAPAESEELKEVLERAGAAVTLHWERYGHQLSGTEVQAAAAWFKNKYNC